MAVERKKFFDVEVPIMGKTIQLYGKSLKEFDKRVIKIDLTRNLRGKSLEIYLTVKVDGNKASFKLAYDQLVGQIRDDIQKMEQYLK